MVFVHLYGQLSRAVNFIVEGSKRCAMDGMRTQLWEEVYGILTSNRISEPAVLTNVGEYGVRSPFGQSTKMYEIFFVSACHQGTVHRESQHAVP